MTEARARVGTPRRRRWGAGVVPGPVRMLGRRTSQRIIRCRAFVVGNQEAGPEKGRRG